MEAQESEKEDSEEDEYPPGAAQGDDRPPGDDGVSLPKTSKAIVAGAKELLSARSDVATAAAVEPVDATATQQAAEGDRAPGDDAATPASSKEVGAAPNVVPPTAPSLPSTVPKKKKKQTELAPPGKNCYCTSQADIM